MWVQTGWMAAAATISGGTFPLRVDNWATISGGTFTLVRRGVGVNNFQNATISGGTFLGWVFNCASGPCNAGIVTGGTFTTQYDGGTFPQPRSCHDTYPADCP